MLCRSSGAADIGAVAADEGAAADQILVMLVLPPPHFRASSEYAGSYADRPGHSSRLRTALQLARDHGLGVITDWPMPTLGVDCFVMVLPPGQAAARTSMLEALGRDPRVVWAQPMNLYRAQAHDDPLFAVQPAAQDWHLADLHRVATGAGVRVAVIDSAVQVSHPDLIGQIESNRNFVSDRPFQPENHGTEVAGIIAASADNHVGIAGVAPGARLLALRACWQDSATATLCTTLSLALALDFAVAQGAQVINLSLAGPPDPLLGKLIGAALRRGIAVVAAFDRALPGGGFPASAQGVIAVADEGPPGPQAGVWLAPGRDIPTTVPPSRWTLVSGASYAAAHVSGLMALLRQSAGADGTVPAAAALVRRPSGTIDACASLLRHIGSCVCSCADDAVPAPTTKP